MIYHDENAVGVDWSRETVKAFLEKQGLTATDSAVDAVLEQVHQFWKIKASQDNVLRAAVGMVGLDALELMSA